MKLYSKSRITFLAAIFLVICNVVLFAISNGKGPLRNILDKCELSLLETLFSVRENRPSPKDVTIIGLDAGIQQSYGLNPSDRTPLSFFSDLLAKVNNYSPKAIGIDFVFKESKLDSKEDVEELARELKHSIIISIKDSDADFSSSKRYADAVEKVAYGIFFANNGFISDYLELRLLSASDVYMMPLSLAVAIKAKHSEFKLPKTNDVINFYGPAGTIKKINALDFVKHPEKYKDDVENKAILIGQTEKINLSRLDRDLFKTPVSPDMYEGMYGVEIHATKVANYLNQDWIRRTDRTKTAIFMTIFIWIFALIATALKPLKALLFLVLTLIVWSYVLYIAFDYNIFIDNAINVYLLAPLAIIAGAIHYYLFENRSKQFIKDAFSMYLSPDVVNDLISHEDKLRLGGETVEGISFFTDIAGFTSFSEKHADDPVYVTDVLSKYTTILIGEIYAEDGTVLNQMGDGLFAFWGAPVKVEHAADKALRAAINAEKLLKEAGEKGVIPSFSTRIGINSGSVTAGNLGSKQRFSYSVIGDSVNTASRFEQLNKTFGTSILFSESICNSLEDKSIHPIYLGAFCVMGKNIPIKLYTVLNEEPSELQSWFSAIAAFESKNWNEALRLLDELQQGNFPLNKLVELYKSECQGYSNGAKQCTETWNGEIVVGHK